MTQLSPIEVTDILGFFGFLIFIVLLTETSVSFLALPVTLTITLDTVLEALGFHLLSVNSKLSLESDLVIFFSCHFPSLTL